MATTPNMGLLLPTPSVTAGPLYAQQEVTAYLQIDQHDHSSGKGVAVGVSGLNINGDLPFNSNNINSARGLRLVSLGSLPTLPLDLRMVYSYNGELYYQDASGNNVQITNAGSVAGATGTITGLTSPASAVFSSGRFTFNKDSSKPGKLSISDINLYEFNNAAANAITIKSPASLAAAYTLTLLTALPSQTTVLSVDSSGQVSSGLANGTAGAPSLAFASDLTTGLYYSASQIGVSVSGSNKLTVSSSAMTFNGMVSLGTSGSAGLPSYSFSNDATTGVWSNGSGNLNFAAGGTAIASVTSAGLAVTTGGIASGTSSSAMKWKKFTGSLTAGNVGLLTISGTITGVVGMSQNNGGATICPMPYSANSANNVIYFDQVQGDGTYVRIVNNDSGHTNTYTVTIFYT